jgi:hypothetical protein
LGCLRLNQGVTGNLSSKTVDVEYGSESVIVHIEADNEYIGPVLGLFSMVTGGALPDPMPLRAREEMRIEIPGGADEVGVTCPSS